MGKEMRDLEEQIKSILKGLQRKLEMQLCGFALLNPGWTQEGVMQDS